MDEKKAVDKERVRKPNILSKDEKKAWEQRNVANKRFFYNVCQKACRSKAELKDHLARPKHRQKVAKAQGLVAPPTRKQRYGKEWRAQNVAEKNSIAPFVIRPSRHLPNSKATLLRRGI